MEHLCCDRPLFGVCVCDCFWNNMHNVDPIAKRTQFSRQLVFFDWCVYFMTKRPYQDGIIKRQKKREIFRFFSLSYYLNYALYECVRCIWAFNFRSDSPIALAWHRPNSFTVFIQTIIVYAPFFCSPFLFFMHLIRPLQVFNISGAFSLRFINFGERESAITFI